MIVKDVLLFKSKVIFSITIAFFFSITIAFFSAGCSEPISQPAENQKEKKASPTEMIKAEPAKAEPAKAEPAKAEPTKNEAVKKDAGVTADETSVEASVDDWGEPALPDELDKPEKQKSPESKPSSFGSGKIKGSIDGQKFVSIQNAIFIKGQKRLILSDVTDTCKKIQSAAPPTPPYTLLTLKLSSYQKGRYELGTNGFTAYVIYGRGSGNKKVGGKSGHIEITQEGKAPNTEMKGTFEFIFEKGKLSGSFSAAPCAVTP